MQTLTSDTVQINVTRRKKNLLTGFIFNRLVASIRPGEAGRFVEHVPGVGPYLAPLREDFCAGLEAVVLPGVLHDAGDGLSQLAAGGGDVVFCERRDWLDER